MDTATAPTSPVLAQDLVERARRDLVQQERHLAVLREQVVNAEQQIERLRAFLNTAAGYLNDVNISVGPITEKPPTQAEALLNATEEEIRTAGRPLTIQELFTRMLDRGLKIAGKNPKANYSWILSNPGKGRLKYEVGHGWNIDKEKKSGPDD